MKQFNNAPLPFMGQKRRFLKELKTVLKDYPEQAIYIDLFGGSGLLSHFVKSQKPSATVIYNDYDNYWERLQHINSTNELLARIRPLLVNQPKDKKIEEPVKSAILAMVEEVDKKGYVDYITLSSSLLFSMKYVLSLTDLKKETLYNVIKQSDYNAAGYLEGVDRVRMDYKVLYELYKDNANVVFLVDPPYLSTTSITYRSNGYWRLKDYLDVLKVLSKHRYIYFTSNKSSIIELCDWISSRTIDANPFNGATTKTIDVSVNLSSSYTDIMIYKGDCSHHYEITEK